MHTWTTAVLAIVFIGSWGPPQAYAAAARVANEPARMVEQTGAASAAQGAFLWQIGKADNDDREFALAPAGYTGFRDDGFFVVGRSKAERDWPYVHPGPLDAWAGSRSHTFTIAFGLTGSPKSADCRLIVDLIDTHYSAPPRLRVEINGRAFEHDTPEGGGDASLLGQPAQGREHKFAITFPSSLLTSGPNRISITTLSGSWVIYDWIGLEAPAGVELDQASGTWMTVEPSPPAVLKDKDGALSQLMRLTVTHMGEEAHAVIRAAGVGPQNVRLVPGVQTVDLLIPVVQRKARVAVSIEVAGKIAASEHLDVEPPRKWVIYILPHSHVDIGYTDIQTNVERRQWTNIEDAIELAKRTASYPPEARYRWNVEVFWPADGYLRQASQERRKEFIQAVKAGWIGIDAFYGNELTALCRPEELIRLMSSAGRFSDEFGVPVDSAMITDVPGCTWGIVSAMAENGIRYLSMGPNPGDRIGYTLQAWADKPFYWVSPSGTSKVLCWMTSGRGVYGGLGLNAGDSVENQKGAVFDYLSYLQNAGYPYDMVQVRHVMGDNAEIDASIADFVKRWNETYAYPKLVISTTSRMFHDFEKAYGRRIPKVSGDFTPYWEDGAGSSARETALNRGSAERLVQAETLYAMRSPRSYPREQFGEAWKNILLYSEHTWGAFNSVSEPDSQFVKDQWKIKQSFALDADARSRKLIQAALPSGSGKAEWVEVYNTSSWDRTDLVVLPADAKTAGDLVKDANGSAVPSQRLSTGELAFLARDVPAFGAKRYSIHAGRAAYRGKASAVGASLAASDLSLRIEEATGAIESLRSSVLGKELVDTETGPGLNDYIYIPGSEFNNPRRCSGVKVRVNDSGPLVASLVIESDAPGGRKLTREVRVMDGLGRVDITDTLDKQAVREKEGVHFGFPFKVPGGVVRMDVPWAVVRPELDQMPGACKNWFTVQRWVDISNKDFGVTWATVDAPLVEIGGLTADRIGHQPDPNAWMARIASSGKLYSWVMNNYWHTNYKADQDGPTAFRYSIRPHKAFRPDDAARFGVERSQPLVVNAERGMPNAGYVGKSRLRVSPAGVLVTALKPTEDGKGLIVRLFAASGKREKAAIKWGRPEPKAVWLSDARERRGKRVTGPVEIAPYGVVTLRAEFP